MTRRTSSERVLRMLSIIPWVASHPGGVAIDELCARFDIDRNRLIADLETASMVGLAPFTPDVLIEVIINDDHVMVTLPQAFRRPLRMSPDQGLALLVRMQGLLAVPGADTEGPLARGLEKLAAAIGVELDTTLGIELGRAEPQVLRLLDTALRSRRRVEFDYYSYGRDQQTHRKVDPHGIHGYRGEWYLTGFCHLTGQDRTFRLDRISTPVLVDEDFEVTRVPDPEIDFRPSDAAPMVELLLEPSARWVIERHPCESVIETEDGHIRVSMRIASRGRLERLLLRLGPSGRVIAGPEDLVGACHDAAQRVLARYQVG